VSTPEPVSRRTALLGLAGLAGLSAPLISGCTGEEPAAGKRPGPTASSSPGAAGVDRPPVDPDVRLAATVLGAEEAMLERVLATLHSHPRLASRLAGARAAHRAHVTLLTRAVPGSPNSVPTSSGPTSSGPTSGGPSGHPTARPPNRPAVSSSSGAALAALRRAEDRLARANRSSALAAESGAFARALGSMAAAAAQQAVHLARTGGDRQ
jgi:hypothetical protein